MKGPPCTIDGRSATGYARRRLGGKITGSAVLDEGDGGDLIGQVVLFEGVLMDEIDGREKQRQSFYVLIKKGPERRLTLTYAKRPWRWGK